MTSRRIGCISSIIMTSFLAFPSHADQADLDMAFAGVLEFSDTGTLFVGDNYNGAIYAFDMTADAAPDAVKQLYIGDIDIKIADVLGVAPSALAINDMVVHPVSQDVYVSVSRIGNFESAPAIIRVTQGSEIEVVDLAALSSQKQALDHYPDQKTTFRPRGLMGQPPTVRDIAKGDVKLSSLAIMDIEFHDGELFVSGVAFDNFLSTLRRIPVPFDGSQTATNVEVYHLSHDQNETRAPIRAMSVQTIDGKEQLVAAYTCSPIALIPLDDIVDGAKITASAISDYGNGQPMDMIPYSFQGEDMLFLTSNSRSPQAIPVASMNDAKVYTAEDLPRGGQMDLSPTMPIGPVGKAVMFDGASLHIDAMGDKFFVSMTRDIFTGSLNLDTNIQAFPNRLHNLVAEYDFPQYKPAN